MQFIILVVYTCDTTSQKHRNQKWFDNTPMEVKRVSIQASCPFSRIAIIIIIHLIVYFKLCILNLAPVCRDLGYGMPSQSKWLNQFSHLVDSTHNHIKHLLDSSLSISLSLVVVCSYINLYSNICDQQKNLYTYALVLSPKPYHYLELKNMWQVFLLGQWKAEKLV